MSPPVFDRPDLMAALHPLAQAPDGPGWNRAELADFVAPDAALIEAAVLVGLVPHSTGTGVLLTRRTDVLRHHAGQVSFPGGRIEPDDADAVAAAVREAGEEIGLVSAQITPLGYLDPMATITGFRVMPVVATIAVDYVPRPDPNEVAEVFEVPLSFVLDPGNLVARTIEMRGRPRQVLEFVNREADAQRIWGATASILWNLRTRLEGAGPIR
jgi:8-oxo-dGTP pyrophosphatase MutT (NUDIX family)